MLKISQKTYGYLVLTNVFYLLLVVLFGAYVRASGSGAGCGSHWPLCKGEILPVAPSIQTIVEFTHRITSGLSLPFALILWFLACKIFVKRHLARTYSALVVFFVILEGLLGAGLVLFEHTASNTSNYRALSMSLHLINTFTLMAMAILGWHAAISSSSKEEGVADNCAAGFSHKILYFIGLSLLLLTGISGAVTALGDTVFPVSTPTEALTLGLSASQHLFIRLRIYHPFIAIGSSAYIIFICRYFKSKQNLITPWPLWITGLVLIQLSVGFLNIRLMAPIWLQLVHLILAQGIWMLFVLLGTQLKKIPLE